MKGTTAYTRGAVLACLGIVFYVVQDLIMKVASGDYPIHQVLVFRALTAIPISVLLVYLAGCAKDLRGSIRPMLPRSLLNVLSNLAYYLAMAALPMATVGALYLSGPLIITAFSVFLLREKVNSVQWAAVVVGFLGVILIIHPGYGDFEWAMLLPIVSASADAGAAILATKAGREDNSTIVALHAQTWISLAGLALAAALGFGGLSWELQNHPSMDFLLKGWQWPTSGDFVILILTGVMGTGSILFALKAYALTEASRLAPFQYTGLLWSIALGWLVFSHLPSGKEWVGIVLLLGAGLVSVYQSKDDEGETQEPDVQVAHDEKTGGQKLIGDLQE